jgi:hypothetical protein
VHDVPVIALLRSRVVAGLAAVLALAALTILSLSIVSPPQPLGANAPADVFSAGRAYATVEQLGREVHPAGSPAADAVRADLVRKLQEYGLHTEVQDAVGGTSDLGGFAMARVRNVVATLPGTGSTGTLFLVAHYDSVQVSHGANDDGAGVSSLLEVARVLSTSPKPRNDIVFVLTDAEEACLCGAEAFVNSNPLAAKGGVVLNFEARGASGPVIMFETSAGNAGLIGVYGSSVPHAVATSFAVEVYRILPNDTDFTPFRESGRFTGLNSAYIDGSAVYHTPQDQASYMDKGTLQAHGDNALALVRSLSADDLANLSKPSGWDATYFPVLGWLLRYPGWLVWPLAIVALLTVGGLAYLVRRRSLATIARLAAGFGLGLIPLLAAPILAQLLWVLLVALRPGYAQMIDPWRPGWFRLAVVGLVATVVLTWYGLLRKRLGAWALSIGALGWLAVLGIVLAALTPGGSYLAALPALFTGGALIASRYAPEGWPRLLLVTAGGAVAVVILAPTVLLFFPALGLATGGVAALFGTMLAFALLPVLDWLYPAPTAAAVPATAAVPTAAAVPATAPVAALAPHDPGSHDSGRITDDAQILAQDSSTIPDPASERVEVPAARVRAAVPAVLAGVLTLAFLATGLAVDRFDAEHPYPTQLMYALDADTNQAKWVSADTDPGPWVGQYMTGHEDLSAAFPLLQGEKSTGPATPAELPAPTLDLVSQSVDGDRRTVTVQLKPQREARLVFLGVPGNVTVLKAAAGGRAVPREALEKPFGLVFHAPPAEGVTITLTFDTTQPVPLRAMAGSDGLNGLPGFKPRPAGVGIEGSHTSELVLVARTYTL